MYTYRVQCALQCGKEIMNAVFMYPEAALRTAKTLATKYAGELAYSNVDLLENGSIAAVVMKHGPYAYLFTETFKTENLPNAL